jgi:HD-GYP domain-containing protein (c-di-GMP phosphodiesterase class II)
MRLFDMVGCLSNAMDLVSPEVVGHHRRVGLIASKLAEIAGLPGQARADLALASILHDVGAFSLKDRLSALSFDTSDYSHAHTGYRLLSAYPGFTRVAELVRLHHTAWAKFKKDAEDISESALANILCLADRVDTLLPRQQGSFVDHKATVDKIRSGRGIMFDPKWVDAFEELASRTGFLEETANSGSSEHPLIPDEHNPQLCGKEISKLSRLFSQIIDFRCRFTATHSRGVSATAMALAHELALDGDSRDKLELAGELHDLGKLGVPAEIILKPAALDHAEMATMCLHAENGFKALSSAPGLAEVAGIMVKHHERLDGTGYPHGLKAPQLSLAARVLAVSDVFTALAEDRPYRAGMELRRIVGILEDMARNNSLDPDVVSLVSVRRSSIDDARRTSQAQAQEDFERFARGLVQ